ncbi:MAG: CopG family transcriptional regulator [Cyanobacteria bacterium J06641_5]
MNVKKLDLTIGDAGDRTCQAPNLTKHVDIDFPAWMVEALDREARRAGVSPQTIVKIWLADRLAVRPNPSRPNR